MDYKERYMHALEKIREGLQPLPDGAKISGVTRAFLEEVFPELGESEDERIKKELTKFLENASGGFLDTAIQCKTFGKWAAWLEKQGEQKVPINDFKAKNWYVSEVDGKIHDMTYNPAEKDEPKFKVGDWIISKYMHLVMQILNNDNGSYKTLETDGTERNDSYDFIERNFKLWTIDDAKDGDVLACGDKVTDCPFIFHNLTEKQNPRSYCGVNTLHHFQDNDENGGYWCNSDEVRPATKEQRDLLFAEMKEAGYEWDAEKKELKLLISNGGDFESNNSKQKPTWSDEDETLLYEIVDYFNMDDALRHTENEIIDWLKSLKERLL